MLFTHNLYLGRAAPRKFADSKSHKMAALVENSNNEKLGETVPER